MSPLPVSVSLLILCFCGLTETSASDGPRWIFKDAVVKRLPVHAFVQILLDEQSDSVTGVGPESLNSFNFNNSAKTPVEKKVLLSKCQNKRCDYNITMLHKTADNQLFICGVSDMKMFVCSVNQSDASPQCTDSEKTKPINSSICEFYIKEGSPSALVESGEKADFYVTYSGSQEHVGIHKFGENKVGPANHNKEQYYLSLMPVRYGSNGRDDKVFAFYKEKNKDTSLGREMWLPFVTRVCMADLGGPKNNLQFSWTSQLNARLFCGDPEQGQHFSELVDVATVEAERWQDIRIYALFRNEWGMSAVCVYTMKDINNTFATSPFRGYTGSTKRERGCARDSKKIPLEELKIIEKTSEMEKWVRAENNSGPLLTNHENYTKINVDSSMHHSTSDPTVLFLTRNDGRIHKVTHQGGRSFIIAEYRPFNQQEQIKSIALNPSTRKLYVNTESELVQLEVANCTDYGDSCQDCVMARDPYCGWDGSACAPKTPDSIQDVTNGNHAICSESPKKAFRHSANAHVEKRTDSIVLPAESKYFLSCPVTSHHAQYEWLHNKSPTPCTPHEKQCLLLINSMAHEQEGTYTCVSEEGGFRKVLAEFKLQMENSAVGRISSPLVWVCVMAVLIVLSF